MIEEIKVYMFSELERCYKLMEESKTFASVQFYYGKLQGFIIILLRLVKEEENISNYELVNSISNDIDIKYIRLSEILEV